MNYTPEQIKLLQQAGIKIEPEQLTQQQKIDALKSKGIDTRDLENKDFGLDDSNLGAFNTGFANQITNELPKNAATALKNLTPDFLGLNNTYNDYIRKQEEESKARENLLTERAKNSGFNTAGNIAGGVVSVGAPILASAATGNPLVIGGTIAGMSAVGGGASAAEFADRRKAELANSGLTPEQIQKQVDEEQKSVFAKATANELASNAVSMGVGGAIGRKAMSGVVGGLTAAGVDAPLGALSGAIDEQIVGGSLAGGVNTDIQNKKALIGGALGGVMSGGFGALEGRGNRIETQIALEEGSAINPNYMVSEKLVSNALFEDGAKTRLEVLNKTNTDPNLTFEIRDAIDPRTGEVIANRKQIYAVKKEIPLVEDVMNDNTKGFNFDPKMEQTVINNEELRVPSGVVDNAVNIKSKIEETPNFVEAKIESKATEVPISELKTEDVPNIRNGGTDIDFNTDVIERRTVTEKYKDENGKYVTETKEILVPKDKDNNGFGLTLEQTMKQKEELLAKGLNDIQEYKTEQLDINSWSDTNRYKKDLINGINSKIDGNLITSVKNTNILDRKYGVYDFHSRATKVDGFDKKIVEVLASVNIDKSEPFLISAKDIKDGQEVTLVREKTKRFPENTAVYVDGVKVGKIEQGYAAELAKFFDSNSVDKISAKLFAVEKPYSKKSHNDRTRHSLNTHDGGKVIGSTGIALRLELNKNADNLTYTVKKKVNENGVEKTIKEEVPIFSKLGNNQEIYGVNVKQKSEKIVNPKQEEVKVKNTTEENVVDTAPSKEEFDLGLYSNEVVKKYAPIKDILSKKDNSPEGIKELQGAMKELQNRISSLNVNNQTSNIKLLVGYKGSGNLYNAVDKRALLKMKEFNDGPGTYYKDKDGNEFIYIDLDKVNEVSLKSDISAEDLAEFVYKHEMLGHGALRNFFKTEEELNSYLDNVYSRSNEAVDYLIDLKTRTYGQDKNATEISHRREMMEEIISDLASGKISYEEDGKMVVKTIDEFAKDFAVMHSENKGVQASVIAKFIDFIKGFINDIVGNDVFKVYDRTKEDLTQITKELEEISKTLQSNYNVTKDVQEFIKNSSPEVVKMYRAMAQNPDLVISDGYKFLSWNNFKEYTQLLSFLKKPLDVVMTQQGKGFFNEKLSKGLDYIKNFSDVDNTVDSILNRQLDGVYTKNGIGWISGITEKEKAVIKDAFWQTKANDKLFTSDELVSKFGFTDKMVDAYNKAIKASKTSQEIKSMSEIYKKAFSLGLQSEDLYNKYRDISNFKYDDFVSQIKKDLSSVVDQKALDNFNNFLLTEKDRVSREFNLEIMPTGTHYLVVKDVNGKTMYFEQFNSEFQANRKKLRILNDNKGVSGLTVEINKTPTKISDLENPDNYFIKTVDEYEKEVIEKYRNGEKVAIPFDYYEAIFNNIDNTSKNVGVNLNIPILKKYIKELEDSGDKKLSVELEKILEQELNPDGVLVTKIRHFNSIYNLGGSVASAITNLTSPIMVTLPYLSRYDGGAGFLKDTVKMIYDSKIRSGTLSKDEMVNHILNKYIKTDNIEQAKKDLNRLFDSGSLRSLGDYEMKSIKNGKDITGKGENVKNVLINGFMWPFAKSEQINRMMTGISALNTAYKNGIDGYTFVRKTIDETQGYYGKANRPIYARNSVGQLIFQFKNYSMNYVELMSKFAYEGFKNGNVKDRRAFFIMAGTLLLLGGIKSLPLASDVGDIIDTLGRVYNPEMNTGKFADILAKNIAGDNYELITHGLFGQVLNMQQRTSFQNMVPGSNLFDAANTDKAKSLKEIGGVTVGNINGIIDSLKEFSKGNIGNGALSIAPSSIRSMYQGIEGGITGTLEDNRGNLISEVDKVDSFFKFFGFQPNDVTKSYRAIERMNVEKQNLVYYKDIIHDLLAEAIVEKNPEKRVIANKMISEYNLKNPGAKIKSSKQAITARVKNLTQSIKQKAVERTPKELRKNLEDDINLI